MLGLVFEAFDGCVTSDAVSVCAPAVFNVTLKVFVPATSAVLPGNVAIASEDVSATWSVTLVSTFQQSSTALTVTLKAVPAVWALGVPVLPAVVPGAAGLPGRSKFSFLNPPGGQATVKRQALVVPWPALAVRGTLASPV